MEQKNTVDDIRREVNDLLTKHLGFEENSLPTINDYALEYIHGLLTELVSLTRLQKNTDKSVFLLTHQSNETMPDGACSDQHIMFKLLLNENEETIAWVKDGENKLYGYEFLIEFDVQDFGYGIYYGCKAIIPNNANVADRINSIKKDWNDTRKAELAKVLTNIFEGISFEKKLIPTTNANNNTFWPFWIRLNENEDIIEVAAMATLFIARFCLAQIQTDCQLPKTTDLNLDELFASKKKKPIYRFTEKCWKDIMENDKSIKTFEDVQKKLETAVKALVNRRVLIKKLEYEYAWQFNEYKIPVMEANSKDESENIIHHELSLNNVVCIHLIKNLWDALRDETPENNQKNNQKKPRNIYLLNQIWLMPRGNICDHPENTIQNKLMKNEFYDEAESIKNHLNEILGKK